MAVAEQKQDKRALAATPLSPAAAIRFTVYGDSAFILV
jgi:hypothetical protein